MNHVGFSSDNTQITLPVHASSESGRTAYHGLGPTALRDLIDENGGKLPSTLTELRKYLDHTYRSFGEILTTTIPFSDAPGYTDLNEARNIYTTPLNDLYIGAIPRENGTVDLEFISRNKNNGEYDFGIIRNFGRTNAEAVLVEKSQCTVCHKGEGPIFPIGPWKNTIGDDSLLTNYKPVYRAFLKKLADKDPAFRSLYEETEKISQRYSLAIQDDESWQVFLKENQDKHTSFPAFLGRSDAKLAFNQALAPTLPLARQWNGALIAPSATGGAVESRVRDGNQVLVFKKFIDSRKDAKERKEFVSWLLKRLGTGDADPQHSPSSNFDYRSHFKDFNSFPDNRNIILKGHTLDHVKSGVSPLSSSVEDILSLSQIKKQLKIRNVSPGESALNDNAFLPNSNPLTGAGFFPMDENSLFFAYTQSLGLAIHDDFKGNRRTGSSFYVPDLATPLELKDFFQSGKFLDLTDMDHLPLRSEFNQAFQEWKGIAPTATGEKNINEKPVNSKIEKQKSCVACHGGANAVIPIPFDPASLPEWTKRLRTRSSPGYGDAIIWLEPVLEKLKQRTMPPAPFTIHLNKADEAKLIEYLESQVPK